MGGLDKYRVLNKKDRNLNRRTTYNLLAVLLIVGLYFSLRLGFGLFTPYNFWTAQEDLKNGKIQIVVVGLPNRPQIEQSLAIKHGFSFKYVGCNVTPELLNGAKYYNIQVERYLGEKNGDSFWQNFQMEIDSLIKVESAE